MSEEDVSALTSADRPASRMNTNLCAPFLGLLPVTGVSVSVVGATGDQSTLCASDEVAARLDEMQFELGEGPHWEVFGSSAPVLIPDLAQADHSRWPVFGAAVLEVDAGALFAIPLVMGAVIMGVVDLYRSTPGTLSTEALATALSLASTTVTPAVRMAVRSAGANDPANTGYAPEMRREVFQATGMILVQLGITATEAFSRLRAHAFASDRTVLDVASDVVLRRLDFRNLSE